MNDPNIGTYQIEVGGFIYLGSSTNLTGQKRNHLKALKAGTHHNHRLQRAYNTHQTYNFRTLSFCTWDQTRIEEQKLLATWYGHPTCLNLEAEAISTNHPSRKLRPPRKSRKQVST